MQTDEDVWTESVQNAKNCQTVDGSEIVKQPPEM